MTESSLTARAPMLQLNFQYFRTGRLAREFKWQLDVCYSIIFFCRELAEGALEWQWPQSSRWTPIIPLLRAIHIQDSVSRSSREVWA
eukprot:6462915-Amphidinium_carterae.3